MEEEEAEDSQIFCNLRELARRKDGNYARAKIHQEEETNRHLSECQRGIFPRLSYNFIFFASVPFPAGFDPQTGEISNGNGDTLNRRQFRFKRQTDGSESAAEEDASDAAAAEVPGTDGTSAPPTSLVEVDPASQPPEDNDENPGGLTVTLCTRTLHM